MIEVESCSSSLPNQMTTHPDQERSGLAILDVCRLSKSVPPWGICPYSRSRPKTRRVGGPRDGLVMIEVLLKAE